MGSACNAKHLLYKVRLLEHSERLQTGHEALREFLRADLITGALHHPGLHRPVLMLQARNSFEQRCQFNQNINSRERAETDPVTG